MAKKEKQKEAEEQKAPEEEKKSPLLFYVGAFFGAILTAIIGSATGAYFGAKSVRPPYTVPDDLLEEEEVVTEQVTQVQGLDLARLRSLFAGGRLQDDAIGSNLAVAQVPGISRYFAMDTLNPENEREITRPMKPREFADTIIEEATGRVSGSLAVAGGLDRSERYYAPGQVGIVPEPGMPRSPELVAPNPRSPGAGLLEETKHSTPGAGIEYNLFAVPDVGGGSEPYEAKASIPKMREIGAFPLESSVKRQGAP